MRVVAADLHIHSALSPCASDEMTPEAIVYKAITSDLEVIAICDHNSAANIQAVQEAAFSIAGDLFLVLPGMEITTSEEVHLVALFPDVEAALAASDEVGKTLPCAANNPEQCKEQPILNAAGEVIGHADRFLSFASAFSLDDAALLVRRYGGLCVAAHVDRPSFSVVSQLGFIPPAPVFDALEISASGYKQGKALDFSTRKETLISSSDAHYPDNIGDGRCFLEMKNLSFQEVKLALAGAIGRRCSLA